MNMFVVFKREDGGSNPNMLSSFDTHLLRIATELVTPPLDGMILPGVTRDSVLALARDHISGTKRLEALPENLVVSERPVAMKEVKAAAQSGHLVELFGTGN
jgi:branched-chain amino acid aminotransferase